MRCSRKGFKVLMRSVVPVFAFDGTHRPDIILVVLQPALFRFAVCPITLCYQRQGDVIPGRFPPHQSLLVTLQTGYPEETPGATDCRCASNAARESADAKAGRSPRHHRH